MSIINLKKFYYRHQAENIHAIKTGIAFALGYLVMKLLPFQTSQWILISIAVIMGSQAVLGFQVNKSILRILGTLIGATFGVIALLSPHPPSVLFILLILLAVISSKLSIHYPESSYAIVLGMITFILIVFSPTPSLQNAGIRVIEIVLGIMICLAVSALIFPFNAKRSFLLAISKNFKNLTQFSEQIFFEGRERRHDPKVIELESKIVAKLTEQRSLIKIIRYEKFNSAVIKKDLMQLYRCQRGIFHYLLFIEVVLYEGRQDQSTHTADFIKHFNELLKSLIIFFASFAIERKQINIPEDLIIQFEFVQKTLLESFPHEKLLPYEQQRKDVILFALRRMQFVLKNLITHWNRIS